jgi:1,4-dihydroxy-2-naphthoate octaprenyltransferase
MIYFIIFIITCIISVLWVNGIDYMQNNYSDYKGEDFL